MGNMYVRQRLAFNSRTCKSRMKEGTNLARMRVMVVDDNRVWGNLLVEYLEGEGWHAQCFDRLQSMAEVKAYRPDIVLMDLDMPVVRGDDLLRDMRQCPELKSIPVIMLTGATRLDDDIVALSQSWLTKPVDLRMLSRRIHELTAAPPGQSWVRESGKTRWERDSTGHS